MDRTGQAEQCARHLGTQRAVLDCGRLGGGGRDIAAEERRVRQRAMEAGGELRRRPGADATEGCARS